MQKFVKITVDNQTNPSYGGLIAVNDVYKVVQSANGSTVIHYSTGQTLTVTSTGDTSPEVALKIEELIQKAMVTPWNQPVLDATLGNSLAPSFVVTNIESTTS